MAWVAALRYEGDYEKWSWPITPPSYASFRRGGIVGSAEIVDVITPKTQFKPRSSAWFEGPYGFVLDNVRPCRFRACRGMPGFFVPEYD